MEDTTMYMQIIKREKSEREDMTKCSRQSLNFSQVIKIRTAQAIEGSRPFWSRQNFSSYMSLHRAISMVRTSKTGTFVLGDGQLSLRMGPERFQVQLS